MFDTTVTPRWLESGDRFWYPYQTREGRKFYLVDPIKKSKAPLFDHAKMAATLTSMTREPYDAQHLPFTTVKFVRKDAAFQFDVQVPRDAEIAKPKKPVSTTDAQAAARPVGQDPADDDAVDPQQQGQRGRGGASGRGAPAAEEPGRCTSSTTWRPPTSISWTTTTRRRSGRDGRRRRRMARRLSSPATTTSS